MMQCLKCNTENLADAAFCAECGAKIELPCPACGASQEPGKKFCRKCGHSLTGSTPGIAAEPLQRNAQGQSRAATTGLPSSFVSGRYQALRVLGEGARKRVFLAHDRRLDRDVAFALIKTEGLDEAGLARIRREAQAMGRLGDHPHIVTVHDIGDEGDQPYIVSQYMSGGSVDELLQRADQHRLPIEQCIKIADQLSQALEHAHARKVIHRDLKPGNVWLTEDGTIKLGDFGLAVAVDRSRLTTEGMVVGTVAYMPPEQALGRNPDARSDLYALGAMLYEMVTGRPPFLGDDAVSIISQHINTPPVAPSWHNPEIPRALEALILRLLAKAPEDRPERASMVRQALQAISATPPGSAAANNVAAADTNPLDRLAGGVFVGRETELDELHAALEEALSGRGRLVMLVGEPGIGKTRTAEEFATYARLRKAQVLWGRCYEGEGAPAYWPWVQAIRSYVHERDPKALLSELGSAAAEIAQVVSEVRERLPGLPEPPPMAPEQARFRLFDGITAFLRNASRNQALLLVLDDLHWADKSSLLLLQFLARELRGTRLVVVGTYRDIELGRQHPLAQTLAELAREQLSQRIVLRGLSEHDVGRFIEITAGVKPPEAMVAIVYKETEGNPFFVNEVVRLLVADGRLQQPGKVKSWSVDIPQGVREVITRRLDRLSPECNRALTVGAVIGREFSLELLERLDELSGDKLLEVLEEATAARVITEIPRTVGHYSFAHALIRETLTAELTTTRRVRLHRQIGEALEALYGSNPEPHLAELAYHFFEAAQGGDIDRAVAYSVRAGDRAAAQMAHEQAVHHYEMGLQALELRDRSDPGKCALLLTLCDALWRAGEYDRAKQTALQTAELARAVGENTMFARAALGYAGSLPAFAAVQRDETLVALFEEALAKLDTGNSVLRARLLARLAEEITFSDSLERRQSLSHEAVAMARLLDDRTTLVVVLRQAHWATLTAANLEQRLEMTNEMLSLAKSVGDPGLIVETLFWRFADLVELGDITHARRDFAAFSKSVEQLRLPYYKWATAMMGVLLALTESRLAEIETLAQQQTTTLGQDVQNQNALLVQGLQLAALYREYGRLTEVEMILLSGVTMYPATAPNLRCAEALLNCDSGRDSDARTSFETLAADLERLPRNAAWLFSVAYLAEICAYLGDTRRAPAIYEVLMPFARQFVTVTPLLIFNAVPHYLGLLDATMERWSDAAAHFEQAIEMTTRMGMRHQRARTELHYAQTLLKRGERADRGKALDLLNRTLEVARELGMKLVLEKALALKLDLQGIVGTGDFKTSIDAVAAAVHREPPDLRRHAAPDGTVTILFTDIEGSTAMTERLGDQRWLELLRQHNHTVREQLQRHGGFEVKSQGDGFMMAFQSARRALQCAIDIQRAFVVQKTEPPEDAIRVRIGAHTGEALKDAGDFFGRNVILAARVAEQATGGEILVSELVRQLTESGGDLRFAEPRHAELKGLKGTYSLHPLEWRD